jgi:hypothetical protein
VGIIARQCAGLVGTPFYRHTGEDRRDPHARFLGVVCVSFGGTNVALALGGLPGATIRTIQIAASTTHARYAGWSKSRVRRPSRCPLIGRPNAARCHNGGTRLCRPSLLRRERGLWQLSTISLGNRLRAAGYGIAAAVLYPAKPGAIQVCSCSRFTRLLLMQLIFLVTDRSRIHGHAP